MPQTDATCIANIAVPDIPVLTGAPALVQPNKSGQTYIRIANCSPNQIVLQRGEFIGLIELLVLLVLLVLLLTNTWSNALVSRSISPSCTCRG